MLVTLLGIINSFSKPEHPKNAQFNIVFTFVGILNVPVYPEHPSYSLSSIVVVDDDITNTPVPQFEENVEIDK